MIRRKNVEFGLLLGVIVFGLTISLPLTAAPQSGTPMTIEPPLGLPPVPIPDDNPMTVEKVELGKMLYFDKRLSKDKTLSCATCHIPEHGYAEPRETSLGIKSQLGPINAPPVINSAYATSMFWDGRMKTLEQQAAGPVDNPIEMGHDIEEVAKEINAIPEYQKRFEDVFGQPADKDTITKAIAAFERTLLAGNSPFDRYQNGDENAISAEAKEGWQLFQQKLCATCHQPPVFSNWGFYNAGVEVVDGKIPDGRFIFTKSPTDKGSYRVPHLRNLKNTSPYLHDGSAKTIEEAVRFMAKGGIDNANLNPLFRAIKAQKITDDQIKKITAFLESLTGEYPIIEEPKLP
ncbi:MAG: c-type cytochrome [Candidatus Omnitrophica bacterium]|nr:c-type cytochrome [Candidatus Omnitrophota bacterium]